MHFTLFRSIIAVAFVAACLCPAQGATASLTWDPNSEPDILGYRVYRSQTSRSGYVPLTTSLLTSTSFVDSTVTAGSAYYYVITAVNSSQLESGFSSEVFLTIAASNRAPAADAGPDKTACPGAYVTITGNGTDTDGDAVSLSWSQTGGTAVAIEGADSSIMSFRAPLVSSSTSLRFRVTASDGRGGSAYDEVLVRIVTGVNYAPVADAGIDRQTPSGQKAKLIGTGSDANGDKVTFSWQQRTGPTVTLQDAQTPIASFTAPTVTTTTSMIFRLTVKDPYGASHYDDVRVFVSPKDSASFIFPPSTQGIHPLLDNNSVSVSFTNLGTSTSSVDLTAFDAAGNKISLGSIVVRPLAQESVATSSLQVPAGYMLRAKSVNPTVKAFFSVTDAAQLRTDSLGGEILPTSVLHFPGASLSSPEASTLLLANPDSASSVTVTLRLYAADGALLKEVVSTLPANAAKQASLSGLFGQIPVSDQGYYLRVSGSRLVEALLIQADSDSLIALPPQILNPSSRLWIPHFVVGLNGEDTQLSVVNEAPAPIRVRVTAYGATSKLAERDTTISGKGLLNTRLSSFFPLSSLLAGQSVASGYLTVDVIYPDPAVTGQKPPLAGAIRLIGTGGKAKAVSPLVSVGRRDYVFLNVDLETARSAFTSMVLWNPGTVATS
ncbi:MAG: hypothetical protein EHM18_11340, partial [Acidobacteria bacterium]